MSLELNVDPQVFRRARRELGLTQSELAGKLAATQSAVSMFEAGHPAALSSEKISAAAEVLGINLEAMSVPVGVGTPREWKYCPAHDCPTVLPYQVGEAVFFAVSRVKAAVGQKTRCRFCGDVLERCCPNPECDAPVTDGAFCECCGTPFVGFRIGADVEPAAYVARRRREVRELREFLVSNLPDCRTHAAREFHGETGPEG